MDRNAQFAACVGALHLHANDNVAVVMADVNPGPINIFGATDNPSFIAKQTIERGHKVALRPIGEREAVVKYGVAIGFAMEPITAGDWVHTHNCRSGIDERSHTLDRHTGAPTDTQYA